MRWIGVLAVFLLVTGCMSRTVPSLELSATVANSSAGVFLGKADAPVVVVEFSDFQCPGCAQSATTIYPVIRPFVESGQVRYVFKDLPLPMHRHARIASQAAHCALKQDRWQEMHDLLFERQERWGNASEPRAMLLGYADELGRSLTCAWTIRASGPRWKQPSRRRDSLAYVGLPHSLCRESRPFLLRMRFVLPLKPHWRVNSGEGANGDAVDSAALHRRDTPDRMAVL
jgi:hypothetical protein